MIVLPLALYLRRLFLNDNSESFRILDMLKENPNYQR